MAVQQSRIRCRSEH